MFKIHSKYTPTGDQPEAIRELSENIKNGIKRSSAFRGDRIRENIYNSQCN